jgi:hypothetical protein
MRTVRLALVAAGILVLGAASALAGSVNCGIVKKDLAMGRTPEDIAERMVISVEEVKKCAEEGGEDAAAGKAGGAAVAGEAEQAEGAAGGGAHEGH